MGVSTAQATELSVGNTPIMQRLLKEAQAYWGRQTNCPSGYYVLVGIPQAAPSVAEGSVLGDAQIRGCWMRLSPSSWLMAVLHQSPRATCVLVTHEYGHSLGEEHSTDPRSVMYAVLNGLAEDSYCDKYENELDNENAHRAIERDAPKCTIGEKETRRNIRCAKEWKFYQNRVIESENYKVTETRKAP